MSSAVPVAKTPAADRISLIIAADGLDRSTELRGTGRVDFRQCAQQQTSQ